MKKIRIVGWVTSALPAAFLLFSAYMKFNKSEEVIKGFAHLGIPESLAHTLGILEIACTVVYLLPGIGFLGAILLTGYLGGATFAHLRVGDPYIMPVIVGVVVWIGLVLRDPGVCPWMRRKGPPGDARGM